MSSQLTLSQKMIAWKFASMNTPKVPSRLRHIPAEQAERRKAVRKRAKRYLKLAAA